jgi:hypothetical protein
MRLMGLLILTKSLDCSLTNKLYPLLSPLQLDFFLHIPYYSKAFRYWPSVVLYLLVSFLIIWLLQIATLRNILHTVTIMLALAITAADSHVFSL